MRHAWPIFIYFFSRPTLYKLICLHPYKKLHQIWLALKEVVQIKTFWNSFTYFQSHNSITNRLSRYLHKNSALKGPFESINQLIEAMFHFVKTCLEVWSENLKIVSLENIITNMGCLGSHDRVDPSGFTETANVVLFWRFTVCSRSWTIQWG